MKKTKKNTKLRMVCPDDVCLLVEGEVQSSGIDVAGKPSDWLNIFCPQGACEISSGSQLP